MSIDYIISEIYNSRIVEIMISDNTILLDYRHQFIGIMYAMNNTS